MTAKQKAAREKFKKVVAEASKLRKKNPKLTQAQAVKQAWAISYSKAGKSKKVAAIKIIEKGESKSAKPKATYQQVRSKKGTFKGLKKVGAAMDKSHKDTKSHNVNIRVVSGINRENGYIGRVIIKKYTLSELKKLNPVYFNKFLDYQFGVYARKLMISPKLNSQIMIEAQKKYINNKLERNYVVKQITAEGEITNAKRFNTILEASNYVGKNIII
jgi:hypothetical protein